MTKDIKDKDSFKDLVLKLSLLSEKVEEAEVAVTDMVNEKSKVETKKQPKKLTEGAIKTDQQMRDILTRFNTLFEENIKPILLEEKTVGEYDLAVKTKATSDGVQVGQWEIKKIKEGKDIRYNINDVNSEVTLLEDINTYSTATAVVKLLNSGKPANGKEVMTFLRLDESFRTNYLDAIHYRKKFLKTGKAIYEDRYEVCKGKALQLKETIKKKSDNLEIL